MRVIKEGQRPDAFVHHGTCYTCKTEVEFKRSEGEITYDRRDGDFVTVTCPVCGGRIHSQITYRSLR